MLIRALQGEMRNGTINDISKEPTWITALTGHSYSEKRGDRYIRRLASVVISSRGAIEPFVRTRAVERISRIRRKEAGKEEASKESVL